MATGSLDLCGHKEFPADLDPEQEMVLAEAVGLVVVERLAPAERVAFVLHDMFDLPFADTADIVGRTSAATRQLATLVVHVGCPRWLSTTCLAVHRLTFVAAVVSVLLGRLCIWGLSIRLILTHARAGDSVASGSASSPGGDLGHRIGRLVA
ncbi:Sigma-70, region 4 [Actinokineospora diospyrosa]|uniref:Sigma-70, region 4 n=1 Tax=Actinokineospora diospyrosa TaxID=103728 RepID=A0ABT1IFR7_9PSEU|nr:Sigma-70, region 4 [Actinokineospora diospyrosa]